uniref:Uncharacterized protein n=1 Tax=Theileria annulata TaxID=5874 RepID=A0A3B0NHP7_THEAN
MDTWITWGNMKYKRLYTYESEINIEKEIEEKVRKTIESEKILVFIKGTPNEPQLVNSVTVTGTTPKGAKNTLSRPWERELNDTFGNPGKGANFTAMECTPGKGANSMPMECNSSNSTITEENSTTRSDSVTVENSTAVVAAPKVPTGPIGTRFESQSSTTSNTSGKGAVNTAVPKHRYGGKY